jgi:GTP diphosphokinase / guanosine-3',5'-bis(diphosphate) 3'-diphosphatase
LLEKPEQTSLEKAINDEKRALYTDEIFIFTPKGDLKRLRAGYTVLDFAFEIHSDVGSTCTGAIVNSKMVPFKHVLQNGDRVKILTSKNQKPSHDWLDIVKSLRTINKIKHVLKMEAYKEADQGKEILKNKIAQLGFEFNDATVNKLIEYFKCENFLELYQGFGEQKFDLIKIKKALSETEEKPIIEQDIIEESFSERFSQVRSGKQDYLIIENSMEALHYQFARCCNPIMGDKIFAFVSVSQGIRIHKTSCPNAKDLITRYPYRILVAKWKKMEEIGAFTANLKITGRYSQDVINKLTHALTYELKVNVRSVKLDSQNDNIYKGEIGIYVTSRSHLEKIMNQMLKMKYVYSVERMGA